MMATWEKMGVSIFSAVMETKELFKEVNQIYLHRKWMNCCQNITIPLRINIPLQKQLKFWYEYIAGLTKFVEPSQMFRIIDMMKKELSENGDQSPWLWTGVSSLCSAS